MHVVGVTTVSIARAVCLTTSLAIGAGCGARSALDGGGVGGDGSGTTSSSPTSSAPSGSMSSGSMSSGSMSSSGASTGGPLPLCNAFVVDGAPVTIPDLAFSPQLAVEGGGMRVAWHFGRFVFSQGLDPAGRWPETFTNVQQEMHIGDEGRFVMAPSSPTPVFFHTENGTLFVTGAGGQQDPVPAAAFGFDTHFLVRNGDAYLYAASSPPFLETGSYVVDGLPQNEEPRLCVSTNARPAAVAVAGGFVAAFADSAQEGTSCDAPLPPPGTSILLKRYDLPATPALASVTTAFVPLVEPIFHLGLAPTDSGAWLVYQTDGSTSLVPPPAMASRVAIDGTPFTQPIAVSPEGSGSIDLAVAGMGEALVVARLPVEKATSAIVVSRIEADGTLQPATTLELGSVLVQGTLRVLATPDRQSVLVAWETTDLRSYLAKLDCVP